MKTNTAILTLTVLLLLFTTAGTAATINTETGNVTVGPGGHGEVTFNITLDSNERVDYTDITLPDGITAVPENTSIREDGLFTVYLLASDDYDPSTDNVTVTFNTIIENTTITGEIHNNQPGDAAFLTDNQPIEEDSETVIFDGTTLSKPSDYTITYEDGLVDLDVTNNTGTVNISYTHNAGETSTVEKTVTLLEGDVPPSEIEAIIEIQSSGPFQRGDYVPIKIVDSNGDALKGCTITASTGQDTTEHNLISQTTKQIFIPTEMESNILTMEVTSCETDADTGYSKTVEVTGWEDFLAQTQLSLTNLNGDNGTLTGTVTDQNGNPVTSNIKITANNTETSDINDNGQFTVTLDTSGDYTVQAVRTDDFDSNTFNSDTTTVTVNRDDDGDGIINENDECPDTSGTEKFNGCNPDTVDLVVFNEDDEQISEGVEEQRYTIKTVDDNGSTVNVTGDLNIAYHDEEDTVTITGGVSSFTPDAPGEWTIHWPGNNKYREAEHTFDANSSGPALPGGLVGIGALLLAVLGGIAAYRLRGNTSAENEAQITLRPQNQRGGN